MLAAVSAPLWVGGILLILALQFSIAVFVAAIAVLELAALSLVHAASAVLAAVTPDAHDAVAAAASHSQQTSDARLTSPAPAEVMLAIRAALSAPPSSRFSRR